MKMSGEMQERFNWQSWKDCVSKGTEGSNPSLSALKKNPANAGLFLCSESVN